MREFKVCVRVRVLSTRPMGNLAGRRGVVTMVTRNLRGGPALYYQVCLDEDSAHPGKPTHSVFQPEDLEPEPIDTP